MTPSIRRLLLGAMALTSACTVVPDEHTSSDAEVRSWTGATDCETTTLLVWLNDPETSQWDLQQAGVHTRGAASLIETRDGADGTPGTDDDVLFATLEEVDAVPQVGESAMAALLAFGEAQCAGAGQCDADERLMDFLNDEATDTDVLLALGVHSAGARSIVEGRLAAGAFADLGEVDDLPQVGDVTLDLLEGYGAELCPLLVMSPQAYDESHLALTAARIDAAEHSLDIAMYSFRDNKVLTAISDAVDRGVSVRAVLDGASEDRKDPEGTRSATLEDLGVEVRWVNKTMHHKYVLIDGPRSALSEVPRATVITGSGNWSYSAGTKYDENTLFVRGDARLTLSLQQEFNLLWENGRDVAWNEDIEDISSMEITDAMVEDAAGMEVWLSSANFDAGWSNTYGPTFRTDYDSTAVIEEMVAFIGSAEDSVWVASGHMRFRPIADALVAAYERGVDVRVYLDQQEHTSEGWYAYELADFESCMEDAAGDADAEYDCQMDGMYFGYALWEAAVPLRYKTYSFHWHYSTAVQLHHKYIIVDEARVATGSYNFSPNAEWQTFENVVVVDGAREPDVVAGFVTNFLEIWDTGRDEARYDALLAEVEAGTGPTPLEFEPMALNWADVTELYTAIRKACPSVNDDDVRDDPGAYPVCPE